MVVHGGGSTHNKNSMFVLMRDSGESPRNSPLLPRHSGTIPRFFIQVGRYLIFNEDEQGVIVSLKELDTNSNRREARLLKAIEENDIEAIENYKLELRRLHCSVR